MKFKDLKLLFSHEIEKIKRSTLDSKQYVIQAYYNVLNKINEAYEDKDTVSQRRINDLPLTLNMKDKLIAMSKKKISVSLLKKRRTMRLKGDLKTFIGIGDKKANELIKLGLTSINQLKQKKWKEHLNKDSLLMMEHKPVRKIEHKNIKKIEKKLVGYSKAEVVLVGSYRRSKPFSKDIDIMVVSNDLVIMDKYVQYLRRKFSHKVFLYSKGDDKISLLIQPFKGDSSLKYKLDIFRTPKAHRNTMLLYSTGSREFNIRMRAKAKRQGMLLNQKGLFKTHNDGSKTKINRAGDGEKKIFSLVGMSYVVPEDR